MLRPAPEHVDVNSSNGDLVFVCPLCSDDTGHMQLSVARGVWYCYRCGQGGGTRALQRRTNIDWPIDASAGEYKDRDNATVDSVLALAFGGNVTAPNKHLTSAVDYARLGDKEISFSISTKAAKAAGLGDDALIVALNSIDPGWWSASSLPAHPHAPAVHACQYLHFRGYTYEAMQAWHLQIALDPAAKSRRHRIIFPCWCPSTGQLLDYRARTLHNAKPKYIGPKGRAEHGGALFAPLARWRAGAGVLDAAVLVEGPLDAARVEAAGFPSVAVLGKQLTPAAGARLIEAGLKAVVVLLDKEETSATYTVAGRLGALGIQALIAELSCAKDPGDAPLQEIYLAVVNAQALTVEGLVLATFLGKTAC